MGESMLYLYDLLKIIAACILGGLIGQQRQRKGMAIGIRTHIVVCVSATLVQIISIDYNLLNNTNFDVMRMGGQVISGIGFLGMASIIRDGRNVLGLTTAASIWFIACVGLAVGSGLYLPAIIATLIIYLILKDVFGLDKRIEKKRENDNIYELEIVLDGAKDNDNDSKINNIFSTINEKGFEISNIRVNAEDRSNSIIFINIGVPPSKSPEVIFSELFKFDFIKKINIV